MSALRFLTAGESHGSQLTAILEGCPAGLPLLPADIDRDLRRRQLGYGRGARQQIETDRVRIAGGVRYGRTTGAPIALLVHNKDAANWGDVLSVEPVERQADPVVVPRPGHADLGGALLYGAGDLRDVIERASARETAARTACGSVVRRLLEEIGCQVVSHVVRIGAVEAGLVNPGVVLAAPGDIDADPVRCGDRMASGPMCAAIDDAAARGDTLGGVFEVLVDGFPAGVGSYVHADRRLNAALAAALMSIPAIKGVEVGLGFGAARLPGSAVHDEIAWTAEGGYSRASNRAGGIEGGMSTGATIVLRAAMKPIATLRTPLRSVAIGSHRAVDSRFERSDTCAVPAAAVAGEAVVALCLGAALLQRFPAATVDELTAAVDGARERDRHA